MRLVQMVPAMTEFLVFTEAHERCSESAGVILNINGYSFQSQNPFCQGSKTYSILTLHETESLL